MRWIYDIGFFTFALFSLPHFLIRLRQAEDPRALWRQRMGFLSPGEVFEKGGAKQRELIWIHCVSVGEALAVEKLIHLLLSRKPELHLALTTVTPAGQRIARQWAGERVSVLYFPFDFSFAVGRFFERLKPSCLLLVEAEIWPNVIQEAKRRGIPVGVINGRISERTFQAFQRFRPIFGPLVGGVDRFLVQTEKDRERLIRLGTLPGRITVTGNMKLDLFDLNGQGEEEGGLLREKWGFSSSDLLLIAGSTHPGEEKIVFRVVRRLRKEGLSLRLLVAPRHIERASRVLALAGRQGFKAVLASQWDGARQSKGGFEVLVLDLLGRLRELYRMADAVFMGGSLVPHGGQNPVEPAQASRPIIHGPWVFNFHEIYRRLEEEGGSIRVQSEEELTFVLKRILRRGREREDLGNRARAVLLKLRGASKKNFEAIQQWMQSKDGTHANVSPS